MSENQEKSKRGDAVMVTFTKGEWYYTEYANFLTGSFMSFANILSMNHYGSKLTRLSATLRDTLYRGKMSPISGWTTDDYIPCHTR